LARRKHADLSGEGARLYGGRYNPKGIPAVYAAQSISLAALEVLVHLEKSEIPDDYVAMGIELGDQQVQSLSVEAAKRIEGFASGQGTSIEVFQREFYTQPVLRVPSVIIPREHNYILLPAAEEFNAGILWVEPFRFDQRLFSPATKLIP
jgi:RES domain-containing protein